MERNRSTKEYKRRKRLCNAGIVFIISVTLVIGIIGGIGMFTINTKFSTESEKVDSQISAAQLKSSNAVLLRIEDQETLLDKNGNVRIYPASLTKIMTALIAIENISEWDKVINLPASIFHPLYEADASMAGFLPDENVRAIDLLYGILLPSGAECSVGMANEIAGSEQGYVKLMNKKAGELGMDQTHFENTTGLQGRRHYTTASDMAKLLEYALDNEIFRDVFTARSYTTAGTELHPDGITFQSTMFAEMETAEIAGGVIEGGKTGYTQEAQLCLASLAKINGEEYILVTANAKGNHQTSPFHIEDAFYIYNQIGQESGVRVATN